MNKKGFTLIELLAVIVIIVLLALITSTSVTKIVKDSRQELSGTQIQLIKSSAQIWGSENLDLLSNSNECYYIKLKDLKTYGLINSNINNSLNNEYLSDDINIKITINNNAYLPSLNYEVDSKNINDCKYIYTGDCFEYSLIDNGLEITNYLDSYTKDSIEYICSKDVIIPEIINGNKVVSIGNNAFRNKNITSLEIPDTVSKIGYQAFFNNNLVTVNIPSKIKVIEEGVFTSNLLESVIIPEGVETIEPLAFYGNKLTSITIPKSVQTIGYSSFDNNELKNINISEGVTTIDSYAFHDNNFTSVVIPSSVANIGDYALYGNNNGLTSVIIKGKTSISEFESFGSEVFDWASGYSEANIIFQDN